MQDSETRKRQGIEKVQRKKSKRQEKDILKKANQEEHDKTVP